MNKLQEENRKAVRRDIDQHKEVVNHPKHYNAGKIEVIDVIEDWKLDFNLGSSVKYIGRSAHRGMEAVDIQKAIWYLCRHLVATGNLSKGAHETVARIIAENKGS